MDLRLFSGCEVPELHEGEVVTPNSFILFCIKSSNMGSCVCLSTISFTRSLCSKSLASLIWSHKRS